MSLPSFPDKDKMPTREEAINQIISSIAMEELGLSHIINAEGEKLQYALGTLDGITGPDTPVTVDELLKLNESVHNTLNGNMMNQFFLKEKLTKALSASVMQGPPGPPGPQGPATIDVDPEVDNLDPGESPTAKNVGPDNQHVTLKFGIPRGAAGAVGTILDSFDTLAELEAAHSTGNQGDAYLVNGVLYIWDTDEKKWKSTGGNLRGPAGPKGTQGIQGPQGITGPQGIQGTQGDAGTVGTLKGSYDTVNELQIAHPSGLPGDMYYVAPDVYVWDTDTSQWVSVGRLSGPQGIQGEQGPLGEQGPQGIQGESGAFGILKASYKSLNELQAAHPTGLPGDMYYVKPDVYAWDEDAGEWVNVGQLSGPQGIQGVQGIPGEQGSQGVQGIQGRPGPQGITGPPGGGGGLVPFTTGAGEVVPIDSRDDFATMVMLVGFGTSSKAVNIAGDGFTLPPGDGYFLPITLAHDITIKSIYFTTSNFAKFTPDTGSKVVPYIILATAKQGETIFTFLQDTKTEVTTPWIGGSEIPANSIVYGSRAAINQTIPAGTRLAICCAFDMKNGNPPTFPVRGYFFYYAGSIYYE